MKRLALGWATLMGVLGTVVMGCAGAHAPGRTPTSGETTHAPKQLQARQIIVALAGEAREQSASVKPALAADYGLVEMGSFPLRSIGLECVVFQVAADRSIAALLSRLAGDPRVTLAQQNQVFRGLAQPRAEPAGSLAYGPALTHADAAQRTRTGKGIRVAVIDTGVAKDHPGLHGRITATKNFVDGGERTFEQDRHGTAVAGVIAAGGDDPHVHGIAPDAEILAIKACWYARADVERALCSSWTLAKALDFAIDAGAQVVNMSLSGPADELLARLIARADERGMIMVAAAAEEGDAPGFPASLPPVIAVLASDDQGQVRLPAWAARASALAAPGVDILTTVPSDGWDFLSGSSLAAAHVAGVVALLLEERSRLTAGEARDVLRNTGHALPRDVREPARDVALVDACAALAQLMGVASCP
jgi:subtilisin family serine protease